MASLMRERRLAVNMTQEQLAGQANVSLAVLRKFERTGKISLESFVKLAFVLGLSDRLLEALRMKTETASLDDILKDISGPKRKRASSSGKGGHD
jgi:transcriptional regulator with XRE-family HTH domain